MAILVYADHNNAELSTATLNAVTAANEMGGDVTVLVAGDGCDAVAAAVAKVQGVAKILVAQDAALKDHLAENVAPLIAGMASDFSHIVAPATTNGKNIMPRAAALLDIQQVSDITEVVSSDTFVRPIYAGNAMATVRSTDAIKMVTVRSTSFDPAVEEGGSAAVEAVGGASDAGLSSFEGAALSDNERPELTTARVVISGGRGMQSGDNFAMLEEVADILGAAVGASRAAVDAGYVPNDYQVGQTGKVVAPELYIAVGISGAIQHLAGMKDSKVIACINKDEEAPIFQVADLGLVADLFEAVPELKAELEKQGIQAR
jgi:electron transfer flavoprotein alpha subunit